MYNDRLSTEVAKERVAQRNSEAEGFATQKRLGYGESSSTKWMFALVLLMVLVVVSLLI